MIEELEKIQKDNPKFANQLVQWAKDGTFTPQSFQAETLKSLGDSFSGMNFSEMPSLGEETKELLSSSR